MQDETPISLEDSPPEPVEAQQLREILQHHEMFRALPEAALAALARSAERIFVAAGTEILRKGSVAEAVFVVEHGRVRCDWGLDRTMLGDLGRGDVFGLGSVLGQSPMSGGVFALRDSRLIRLCAAEVPRAVAEHPDLLTAYSRWHHDVALRSHGMGSARKLPNAFAVLPLGDDPAVAKAQGMLCEAFARVAGATITVDGARVREILGAAAAASVDFELAPAGLLDWCEAREAEGNGLFFCCDAIDSAWTRWCLRQTDKIVIVAHADADVDLQELDRRFAGRILGIRLFRSRSFSSRMREPRCPARHVAGWSCAVCAATITCGSTMSEPSSAPPGASGKVPSAWCWVAAARVGSPTSVCCKRWKKPASLSTTSAEPAWAPSWRRRMRAAGRRRRSSTSSPDSSRSPAR
jgi:CRP-like cAMP-binding protein